MNNDLDEGKRGQSADVGFGGFGAGAPLGGVVLILVGVYFLLRNAFGWDLDNWWALFILLPAVAMLGRTFSLFRTSGRVTPAVVQSLVPSLMMILVAVIFLFNLDWSKVWPLFLIVAGVAALAANQSARRA